ncbi:MAG TPA: DEAD/DEAH box helicase [Candidatus Marinimicrobia bacterium]|nr:DEAD/DEAH box helicase [Candidatus Neomarinimicrobiota bacterium]
MIDQISILNALGLSRFTAVDVETTGLDEKKNSIIQIAATRFDDGKVTERFSFFCKPDDEIPEHIQELTRITPDMVKDALPFQAHIPELLEFIGNAPIVGHNVNFDIAFIKEKLYRPLFNELIDTLELSRIFLYWLPERKLESLANWYKMDMTEAHRADVDTEFTGYLLLELLQTMLRYDYPLFQTIRQISGPLDNAPNHGLYQRIVSYYENEGRTQIEKWQPEHPIAVNHYGSFKVKLEEYYDEDDENDAEAGEIRRVNSRDVKEIFDFNGALSQKLPDYETRIGQIQLSGDIVETFNRKRALIAEAGTGVGKSLAYLIPAIQWVQANRGSGYSAVISSNTKSLQEQLFFKDIPFVYEHIDDDFTAVMLKGRNNYICLTKWDRLLKQLDQQVNIFERAAILPLVLWVRETQTGDIEENIAFRSAKRTTIWSKVCSEPGFCTTKKCASHRGCYLGKIRKLAKAADIIVINHSLLLSDAVANNSVLPNTPMLIIDEAHNLQKTAHKYFALEFAPWIAGQHLDKLFRGGADNFGSLVNLSRKTGGEKWDKAHQKQFTKLVSDAESAVERAASATKGFFTRFLIYINERERKQNQRYTDKRRYKAERNPFEQFPERESLLAAYLNLKQSLNRLEKFQQELLPIEKMLLDESWTEFANASANFAEFAGNVAFLLDGNDENYVFWYEIPNDSQSTQIVICGTPLRVDKAIFEKILSQKKAILATSATLSVNGNFDYFLQQTGFYLMEKERLHTARYPSPFIYEEQARAWVITFLGEPSQADFDTKVAALMTEIAKRYQRGTLLLTTSYHSIRKMREEMNWAMQKANLPLLTQAGNASRTALLNRFKELGNATLIGTESFWEGVDVPGSALEILAMLKLPFAVPSEPIVEAITEDLKKQGKNSFMEYSVPEAVLKFKQGFGRLIRSTQDTGIALFFDNRLSFKRYGQVFLNSLPLKVGFVKSEEELFKNLDFFYRMNHRQQKR